MASFRKGSLIRHPSTDSSFNRIGSPKNMNDSNRLSPPGSAPNSKDIYEACCEGRISVVKELLTSIGFFGRSVDQLDSSGLSPLHYAVRYNHLPIVKLLLAHGANSNTRSTHENCTPLHYAAMYQHASVSEASRDTIPLPDTTGVPSSQASTHAVQKIKLLPRKYKRAKGIKKGLSYDSRGMAIKSSPDNDETASLTKSVAAASDRTIIGCLLLHQADLNSRDKFDATPLHYAAMRRNVYAVEELIKYSVVNIEAKDVYWRTPLHYASEQGCMPIVSMLVENNAGVYVLTQFDSTPLHYACEENYPAVAEYLINTLKRTNPQKLHAYINHKDRNSHTALHYASMCGGENLVTILLEFNADPSIASSPDLMTPVHLACSAGNLEILKLLVERGDSCVNAVNLNEETPLHMAALLNRIEIVNYLASLNINVDCFDKDHETPLVIATKMDYIDIVKALIDQGASIDSRNMHDLTPLHIAALSNSLNCAEHLLSLRHASNLQNMWDCYENRPIHMAVRNNRIEMVKLLLEHDAPVDSKNDFGLTPLLLAASLGWVQIIKILIEYSPTLALDKDDNNNSALHLAAEKGHFRIVPLLVKSGISVNSRNCNQYTALDVACINGHSRVAQCLIEADAVVNLPENSKFTPPLTYAAQNGNVDVVNLLLGHDADVGRADLMGRNCLEVAIDENQTDTALAIVNSKNWVKALRHVSVQCGKKTTPFRSLVREMPDVARVVLDKCMTTNKLPRSHPKHEIHCNYEFLEDIYTLWGQNLRSSDGVLPKTKDERQMNFFSKIVCLFCSFFSFSPYKPRRKHPISIILKKNRTSLLKHPLVRNLVRFKWANGPCYAYYFKVMLMLVYIILLIGICVVTASPNLDCIPRNQSLEGASRANSHNNSTLQRANSCDYCPSYVELNTFGTTLFFGVGHYLVLLIAVCIIFYRLTLSCLRRGRFPSFLHTMEFIAAILVVIFIIGVGYGHSSSLSMFQNFRCTNWHFTFGATALCLSCMSFVLSLTMVPKIGIYIVMYMDIFRTFFQFMPVYFMLVLSFALPFHMIFIGRADTTSFLYPAKAIIKTLVATVGEIEYDTFYNTPGMEPPVVAYIILFLFITANSIILMNLLVGLAVDDIQGVQSKAFITRLSLQIKTIMDIESLLPAGMQKSLILIDGSMHPNESKTTFFWSLWEFKSNPFLDEIKHEDEPADKYAQFCQEIRDSLHGIKQQVKTLHERQHKFENAFDEMIKRSSPEPTSR